MLNPQAKVSLPCSRSIVRVYRRSGKFNTFFNTVIMPNAILSIAGSSHQYHERFSDISRGIQRSFMSFSELLCAQSCPVRHWDTATVDQNLIEGDTMYLLKVKVFQIPDLSAKSSSLDSSIARH